ncbi:CopG family transcriptional regulator [Mesorhizobium sp. B3-1-7]|uniref:CopG family transcriptional regulator n=1 Tax=Mesorhizobium sp. B3-1-7 TaxID=2589894 RepID=UPI00112E2E9A|nr:CopG family transcriptional regulator [Mesorhizobium sp. B3-1-7]TPI54737.1 CopG family transcriptional regulator [Mesorhizobium sp. B3-1-7]
MSSSTINPIKKSRGRPAVDSDQVNIRLVRSDLDAIDAFAAEQADSPTRPEAIRRIMRNWLQAHNYLSK